MSRAAAIAHLPDEAQVPVKFVRELLEEQRRERIEERVIREETIAMYVELTTRHLCVTPSE